MRHMRGATPALNLVVESERILTNILPSLSGKFGVSNIQSLEAVAKRDVAEGRPLVLLRIDARAQLQTIGDSAANLGTTGSEAVTAFCKSTKTAPDAINGLGGLCSRLVSQSADAYVALVLLDQQTSPINPIIRRLLLSHCSSEVPATVIVVSDEPITDTCMLSYMPVIHASRPAIHELSSTFSTMLERSVELHDHELTASSQEGVAVETIPECSRLLARSLAGLDFPMAMVLLRLHMAAKLEESEDNKALSLNATELASEKAEVLNQQGFVTLINELFSEERIGGLARLKQWIRQRKLGFTEHAHEQKLALPKGVMLVGPPGTAKSLSAKMIAHSFGMPLIRLDIGALFNKMLGSSERSMRTALSIADASAPCVLLLDECDKAMGGMDGSTSDGGTSSRMRGTLLTWLAEKQSEVFVVATANNILGMPPEMTRAGRWIESCRP